MLTKYELVNVPAGGVDRYVGGRRWSITPSLTDQQADFLINAGVTKYFRPIQQSNGKEKTSRSAPKRDANGRFTKA